MHSRPLPYAESAYVNLEAGQTMINGTDGKVIRLPQLLHYPNHVQ